MSTIVPPQQREESGQERQAIDPWACGGRGQCGGRGRVRRRRAPSARRAPPRQRPASEETTKRGKSQGHNDGVRYRGEAVRASGLVTHTQHRSKEVPPFSASFSPSPLALPPLPHPSLSPCLLSLTLHHKGRSAMTEAPPPAPYPGSRLSASRGGDITLPECAHRSPRHLSPFAPLEMRKQR